MPDTQEHCKRKKAGRMLRTILPAIILTLCVSVSAFADGGYQMYEHPEYWYEEIGVKYPATEGNIYILWDSRLIGTDKTITGVTIPDTVTQIGTIAFANCTKLRTISIPSTVLEIDREAFRGCDTLTEITVDPDNPNYSSRDGILYNKDQTRLICYPAGKTASSWQLPDAVLEIEPDAFATCLHLKNIQTGDGQPSFTSLDGVLFSRDLTTLISFPYGRNDPTYTLPSRTERIAEMAFYDCDSLKEVVFPETLRSIGARAFEDCDALTAVSLGDQLQEIGESAFRHCSGLKTLDIGKSACTLGSSAFDSCTALESVHIDDGCLSIGQWAFESCDSLQDVQLPDSVRTLGSSSFYNCDSLVRFRVPAGVENLVHAVLYACDQLRRVEIPQSVRHIDSMAMSQLALTDIYYSGSEEQWNQIGLDDYGSYTELKNARIHCNSTMPDNVAGFYDVFADDAFATAVLWAKEHQVTSGVSATRFDPASSVTRAQAVTFLWRAMGQPEPEQKDCPFRDVRPDDYYYKAVLWAMEWNITKGTGADAFSPSETCSHAHILTWLWRCAGKPGNTGDPVWYQDAVSWAFRDGIAAGDVSETGLTESCPRSDVIRYLYQAEQSGALSGFLDVPADAYYAPAVRWAVEKEITNGISDLAFGPEQSVTRAQAVTFLWRAMGRPEPEGASSPFIDVHTGDYFYQPVLRAVEQGITNGTGASTFSPLQTCSQAHILTWLWRTAGRPDDSGAVLWYEDAANWAQARGLTEPVADHFRLEDDCSRADMVTWLYEIFRDSDASRSS